MFRGLALALLTVSHGLAPIQCGSGASAERAYEETPGEALYMLAGQFKEASDDAGWRRTLEYLIVRYPSSRFAVTAKQDLRDAGIAPPDSPGEGAVSDDDSPAGTPAVTAK